MKINHTFKVGDEVRLINGHTMMIVRGISKNMIYAKYPHQEYTTGYTKNYRDADDYVYWDENRNDGSYEMGTLYQVKGKAIAYGKFLAQDSKGNIVLEMQHTNKILPFHPDNVERVRPYTIDVQTPNGAYKCSYSIEKGLVKVGDNLISNSGNIYTVKAVDTKEPRPKKRFEGKRLVTEEL